MKIHKDFKRGEGMFEFETQLSKLKHEVLTEVIKLATKDKLTREEIEKVPHKVIEGEVAMYRCCVYKERAKEVFNRSNLKADKKTALLNNNLEKYKYINLERD